MFTSSGIPPGNVCVAQAKHGSYARNAISTMFSVALSTFPFLITPLAASLTDMFIAPALLVVATIRLVVMMVSCGKWLDTHFFQSFIPSGPFRVDGCGEAVAWGGPD